QKLEKLYSMELRDDPVQIVVAKGAYIPQYVKPHPGVPIETAEVVQPAECQDQPTPRPTARPALLFPAALLLTGAIMGASASFLIRRGAAEPAVDAVVREAWRPMGRPDANVLLCAATPLHLVVGPEGHQAYGSPTFPAPPEAYSLFRQHRPLPPGNRLGL